MSLDWLRHPHAVLGSRNLNNVKLFEGRLQSLHMFQVGCHLKILGLLGPQKLVDHQLGVRANVEFLNPHVFGKVDSSYEFLVLYFVIHSLEATMYNLLD